MKKLTKTLALLLAGLLTASLLSCQPNVYVEDDNDEDDDNEKVTQSDEDDDNEKGTQSDNKVKYDSLIGMNPTQLQSAIQNESDLVIIAGLYPSLYDKANYRTLLYKDGDLYRLIREEYSEDQEDIMYDIENSKEYTHLSEDGWTVSDLSTEITLELLMKQMNLESTPYKQLLDPQNYGEYNSEYDCYILKEDAAAKISTDIDATVEGYMTSNETEYLFVLGCQNTATDETVYYKITVTFGNETVNLPSVED